MVLAMVVGEGLISALGYQSGAEQPVPVGPALLAGVPALLILITPGVAAVYYGRRASHAGRRDAKVPTWIGGVAAVVVGRPEPPGVPRRTLRGKTARSWIERPSVG
jgi:hypothetical protein